MSLMRLCRLLTVLIVLLPALRVVAQEPVTYAPTDADIPNPERGFYRYSATHPGDDYQPVDVEQLRAYRRDQNVTLLFRYFYLDDFKDRDISQAYLDRAQQDLDAIREAGAKVIVRFAYTNEVRGDFEPPYGDAPKQWVLRHIEQLEPLLQAHSDVIAVLQAGFIGIWGEWYYTDYFANPHDPSSISQAQYEARMEVLEALLDALPEDRMVQIRYVFQKQVLFGTGSGAAAALGAQEAYGSAPRARVGYHNDCFLASETDYGTYHWNRISADKAYLAQDSRYVPVGGETCNPNPPRSACESAVDQLARFHWSYLNRDYHEQVIGSWYRDGCIDTIKRKLGYRLVLSEGTFSESVAPGGGLAIDLSLRNEGWAAPYNPRRVELLLRRQEDGELYGALLPDDPRYWLPDSSVQIHHGVGLPSGTPEGTYDVLLHLADPEPRLRDRPAYAIRLANEDVWEAATGFNHLATVQVSREAAGEDYDGDLWFAADAGTDVEDAAAPGTPGPDVSVYPNPFREQAIVTVASAREADLRVELVDVLGRRVGLVGVRRAAPGQSYTFDVGAGGLPNGTYFVRVNDRQSTTSHPVVLLR